MDKHCANCIYRCYITAGLYWLRLHRLYRACPLFDLPVGARCTEKKTVQRTPPNPNGRPKAVFDEATCMQLYQKGMSDIKIGKHFGLSKNPIAAWRVRNNLPSNSKSPQARMAFLNGR